MTCKKHWKNTEENNAYQDMRADFDLEVFALKARLSVTFGNTGPCPRGPQEPLSTEMGLMLPTRGNGPMKKVEVPLLVVEEGGTKH